MWCLRKNGRQVDCELRFQGESYGWECQRLRDGELAAGDLSCASLALEEAQA